MQDPRAHDWSCDCYRVWTKERNTSARGSLSVITLLLTRPHCSRAVSTFFLSENILRILKDREHGRLWGWVIESSGSESAASSHGLKKRWNERDRKREREVGADWLKQPVLTSSQESSRPDSPAALTWCTCSRRPEREREREDSEWIIPDMQLLSVKKTHTRTQLLTLWGGRCSVLHSGKVCLWPTWIAHLSKSANTHDKNRIVWQVIWYQNVVMSI